MRTRVILLLAVSFMLISLPGFSQVNQSKGFGNNDLEEEAVLEQTGPLYSESKKVCHALAFGVLDFDSSALPQLDFPDEDCRAFLDAVDKLFRFEYTIRKYDMLEMENARRTYLNVEDILSNLADQEMYEGDIVLMYFSGHGLTHQGDYYFPLKNSDYDSHWTMISGTTIFDVAAKLANKGAQVYVFLDTCQSGSILEKTVNLTGQGGLACFPACSASTTTWERLDVGGSSFGDRLRKILSGEDLTDTDVDTMSTEDISNKLIPVMRGGVRPKYFDSSESDIGSFVLVHNVSGKNKYNAIVDRYQNYINNGSKAINERRYYDAVMNLSRAKTLGEKTIKEEDRQDLSKEIASLAKGIAQSTSSGETDDIWKDLANLKNDNDLIKLDSTFFVELCNGCGRYYKAKDDAEMAFPYFLNAFEWGDKKDAPFDLYILAAKLPFPSDYTVTSSQRQNWLQTAADNGNKEAIKIMRGNKRGFVNEAFKNRPWWGVSLVSDAKMFPIGVQGNIFWGLIHIGVDVSMGSDLFRAPSSSSPAETTPETIDVTDGKLDFELVSSEYEKPKGVVSYTVTPGFFYQSMSIDIGLGQIWTATNRIDTYTYSYQTVTTPLPSGGSTSTSGGGRETRTVTEKNHYFVIRPGMTLFVEGKRKRVYGLIGVRARICPADKTLYGGEFYFGIVSRF